MFRKKHLVTTLSCGQQQNSLLVPILLTLLLIAVSIVAYGQLSNTESEASQEEFPASSAKPISASTTKAQIIAAVEKMTILPEDEDPVLGTVQDPALLADQPFFQYAERGDRVLIYQRAKRAILYRPSTGKIIETMPFDVPLQVRGQ